VRVPLELLLNVENNRVRMVYGVTIGEIWRKGSNEMYSAMTAWRGGITGMTCMEYLVFPSTMYLPLYTTLIRCSIHHGASILELLFSLMAAGASCIPHGLALLMP
jgi:hypothetical protein